jgi:hypothetical protein
MKLVRPPLIGLAAVAVILAIVVSIAFTSGFQTWAARKALASRPGIQGTVGHVSAGLRRVEVNDGRFVMQGVVLTLPSLEANLPVLSAGLRDDVAITRLVAKGWVLDLTNAEPTVKKMAAALQPGGAPHRRDFSLVSSAFAADSTAAPARIFRGVFAHLELPVDLTLDGVDLEGEIIVAPAAGKPAERIKLTIRGGGLGAGRSGNFTFTSSAAAGAGVAPISAQALQGTLTAAMDTPRSFTRLALKAEASASGTQFPRGVKLNIELTAARDSSGERYALSLAGEGTQLAGLEAALPLNGVPAGGSPKLNGTWKINLRDSDLVPFALGFPLPVFEAAGEGAFNADAAFAEIQASGKINATADKLASLQPELEAIGAVRLVADFDLAQQGDTLRIQNLTADLSGAKPVLSVRALQSFDFNPKTGELTADPTRELLGIQVHAVPLTWVQPFLRDLKVSGGDLSGEFLASAVDGGLTLRPKTPLAIAALAVSNKTGPLVRNLDVTLNASADYTPQGWQVVLSPFTARSGTANLLSLEGKAGRLAGKNRPVKATGKLIANLPGLLAQPAAGGATRLVTGEASVDFSASFGAKQEFQAKLAIANLTPDANLATGKIPDITADFRADREADGKITLNMPLVVERDGRKSDLKVAGTLIPDKSGMVLDAHVTSTLLVIDDVQILAVPFGSVASEAATTPGKNPPRDTTPVWAGISGKLTLALQKIIYSETLEVADVNGTLRLEAGALKLEGLRAGLGEASEAKLEGAVTFDGKVTEPYSLKADLVVNNFDSVPLFRALDATKAPTVEGKFDVTSELAGTGSNLGKLMEQTSGTVQMISKGGIFRGLRSDVADAIKASPPTLSGIVTGIGSLLGKEAAEKAEKLGADINKRGKLISDIAASLAEIPYDQLSVSLVREASLDLNLKEFTLISPELRLGGTGQITFEEGTPMLSQALDLRVQLGARGKLAESMNRAGLLAAAQDDLGYAGFVVPLHLGGSLGAPDTSELKRELLKAATGSLLNSIIGR